jgi:hypothetical protein
MMKSVLALGAAMLAGVRAQDTCADPLSQDTMIQVRPSFTPAGLCSWD